MCKQQGGEYGPRNANKGNECNILPMGPIRQDKAKMQIRNIDNIWSVQRQIWKLFRKLKNIDKLKV